MAWVEFEVNCESFEELVVCVVVWVAVVFDEHGLDAEGRLVLPVVVNEGDGCYALSPEPQLSVRLMVCGVGFQCLCSDEDHALE